MAAYVPRRLSRGESIISVRNIVCAVACYALTVLLALMIADMPRTAAFLIGVLTGDGA